MLKEKWTIIKESVDKEKLFYTLENEGEEKDAVTSVRRLKKKKKKIKEEQISNRLSGRRGRRGSRGRQTQTRRRDIGGWI